MHRFWRFFDGVAGTVGIVKKASADSLFRLSITHISFLLTADRACVTILCVCDFDRDMWWAGPSIIMHMCVGSKRYLGNSAYCSQAGSPWWCYVGCRWRRRLLSERKHWTTSVWRPQFWWAFWMVVCRKEARSGCPKSFRWLSEPPPQYLQRVHSVLRYPHWSHVPHVSGSQTLCLWRMCWWNYHLTYTNCQPVLNYWLTRFSIDSGWTPPSRIWHFSCSWGKTLARWWTGCRCWCLECFRLPDLWQGIHIITYCRAWRALDSLSSFTWNVGAINAEKTLKSSMLLNPT